MNNLDKIKDFAEKFDKFRNHLREECTKPSVSSTNSEAHKENKNKFDNFMEKEIGGAKYDPKVSHNDLFTRCWEKVVFANKNSDQASKEIESMKKHKIFPNFDNLGNSLDVDEWEFDVARWRKFREYWQNETGEKSKWLEEAKKDKDFTSKKAEILKNIGTKSWGLMTKDENIFPQFGEYEKLKFSSHEVKMDGYKKLIKKFYEIRNEDHPMKYFVGNSYLEFDPEKISTKEFWDIQKKFQKLFGKLASLHLLMEIGFPCLKPDKVITRLFCDIGFLDPLLKIPKGTSDENWTRKTIKEDYTEWTVIKLAIETGMEITKYMDSKYGNKIRELDLFIVKYGQERSDDIGIVRNLNSHLKDGKSISDVIEHIDNEKVLKSLYKE